MKKTILIDSGEQTCALVRTAAGYELQAGERSYACSLEALGDGRHRVRAGNDRRDVHIAQHGDHVWIHVDGRAYELRRVNPLDALAARVADSGSSISPMPGTILTVQVKPGDWVLAGQVLLTMESMKLEVTITAPHDGEITEVLCAPGQTVAVKATLVRFAGQEGARL